MSTVLCLTGAFGRPQNVPGLLQGVVCAGNDVYYVNYSNWGINDGNLQDGAHLFDDAIHAIEGDKVGFGYSLGAGALTYWLANYGPTSDIPASELSFVLVGNPMRRYGGRITSPLFSGSYIDKLAHDWTISPVLCPINTPYTVTDFAAQYDGVCDAPYDASPLPPWILAEYNSWIGTATVHPAYDGADLDDMDNDVNVENNVTYILHKTMPLPMLGPILNPISNQADIMLRPIVEQAYGRDFGVPDYLVPSLEPFPEFAVVDCAEPDHFYVRNGNLTPQPWMHYRHVASDTFGTKAASLQASSLGPKSDRLQRLTAAWINLSPLPHHVHGIVTRGGARVTLQARSRAYLRCLSSIAIGTNPGKLTESSRVGVGGDIGLGGILAIGTGFCIPEIRQNTVSFPVAPERGGWLRVEPGETVVAEVELHFISEYWEQSTIDGGDIECESSYLTGETRLDLFAVPIIDPVGAFPSSPGSG